ncbi:MAG TPA: DsbA family protein [Solirubrobacterales bacterium]|nr:DsbA family protein [Solirubrobacterales bacterium]
MPQIKALLFNDPSCPFGYSASPALRAIEWRYRDQIEWHLAVIGLSDENNPVPYSREEMAGFLVAFRDRYGMPFSAEPKARAFTSSQACRVITAARLLYPGSEWRVFRALQLLHFNTPLLLDDRAQLREALGTVPGIEPELVMAALNSVEVNEAFRTDFAHARNAAGSPSELQGKTAATEDGARYTAPTVVFECGDKRAEVGGFQPLGAYDVVIANLDPNLTRKPPAGSALEALLPYPAGLTTVEVATVMAEKTEEVDREGAEKELLDMLARESVKRVPLGNDAIWVRS